MLSASNENELIRDLLSKMKTYHKKVLYNKNRLNYMINKCTLIKKYIGNNLYNVYTSESLRYFATILNNIYIKLFLYKYTTSSQFTLIFNTLDQDLDSLLTDTNNNNNIRNTITITNYTKNWSTERNKANETDATENDLLLRRGVPYDLNIHTSINKKIKSCDSKRINYILPILYTLDKLTGDENDNNTTITPTTISPNCPPNVTSDPSIDINICIKTIKDVLVKDRVNLATTSTYTPTTDTILSQDTYGITYTSLLNRKKVALKTYNNYTVTESNNNNSNNTHIYHTFLKEVYILKVFSLTNHPFLTRLIGCDLTLGKYLIDIPYCTLYQAIYNTTLNTSNKTNSNITTGNSSTKAINSNSSISIELDSSIKHDITIQLASAIRYIHYYSVCHCNITAHNIYLYRTSDTVYTAKLTNFAYAKPDNPIAPTTPTTTPSTAPTTPATPSTTPTTAPTTTDIERTSEASNPAYISANLSPISRYSAPELLKGHNNNITTDIYAFGLLINELYTELIPFYSIHDDVLLQSCISHLYDILYHPRPNYRLSMHEKNLGVDGKSGTEMDGSRKNFRVSSLGVQNYYNPLVSLLAILKPYHCKDILNSKDKLAERIILDWCVS